MPASSSDCGAYRCLAQTCASASHVPKLSPLAVLNILLPVAKGTSTGLSACEFGPVLCGLRGVRPAFSSPCSARCHESAG